MFGTMLHTHTLGKQVYSVCIDNNMYTIIIIIIIGSGLLVQHFRENKECGVLEEMEPIDENRRYDFNYQQFTYLNKEVQVLPVSISSVVLKLYCGQAVQLHTSG